MSVLLVDIPPHYGMLLSRKWSTSMGGSLQCDLSYATFCIDGKNVKIDKESKVPYMMVHEKDPNEVMTCFIDMNINAFRVENSTTKKREQPTPLEREVEELSGDHNL